MASVVELLALLLDRVPPPRDLDEAQWKGLVVRVKSTLFCSKELILSSSDPLIEGLSTLLNSLVANKYAAPGSSLHNALLLNRFVPPTSSQRSSEPPASASSVHFDGAVAPHPGQDDHVDPGHASPEAPDDDEAGDAGSAGKKLIGMARRLFKKKSARGEPEPEAEAHDPTAGESSPSPQPARGRRGRKRGKSLDASPPTSSQEPEFYERDPYPLRSGRPKGGARLGSRGMTPVVQPTSRPESSVRVPPLDLESIKSPKLVSPPAPSPPPPEPAIYGKAVLQQPQPEPVLKVVPVQPEPEPPGAKEAAAQAQPGAAAKPPAPPQMPLFDAPSALPDGQGEPAPQYTSLRNIVGNMNNINVYLVAVEMIRATVRNLNTQKDVYNYRAIDPTLHSDGVADFSLPNMDYSIQIVTSNATKQHHINFGDILRVKRVDAFLREDKLGKKHINILMTKKNFPSMRLWHCSRYHSDDPEQPETQRLEIDFNKATDSTRAPRSRPLPAQVAEKAAAPAPPPEWSCPPLPADAPYERVKEVLQRTAVNVCGGPKVNFDHTDYVILRYLKDWALKMDPLAFFGKSEFLRKLQDASEASSDFIVKVLVVQADRTLIVGDSSARALAKNFDPLLVTNLFDSANPLKPGDWLKLRSFTRIFNDQDNLIWIGGSTYSCVTRLPPMPGTVAGEEALAAQWVRLTLRNVRKRRVNLDVWAASSCLNTSFPKRFRRSPGFIHKVLYGQPVGQFKKASPRRLPEEREEGEISQ